MNEKLRKAIEEAAIGVAPRDIYSGHVVVSLEHHKAYGAKLMRVIELLVEQRNKFADCCDRLMPFDEAIQPFDAELIAALEGK